MRHQKKKGGTPGATRRDLRDTKASVTFGETSGKAKPRRWTSELGCQTQQSPDSQVSGAVTRWGVAGPWLGRGWAVPGAGLVSSGANERSARRGLGARSGPCSWRGGPRALGAVPAPGGAGRGATEGSPWARRRRRMACL